MSILKMLPGIAVLLLWSVAGCGPTGPKLFPINGKLELTGGEVADLTGGVIEVVSKSDNTLRASGGIRNDGTFEMETLYAGVIRKGVPQGDYQVRIHLPDDDKVARQKAARAIARRYQEFESSELSLSVPQSREVVLTLSPR